MGYGKRDSAIVDYQMYRLQDTEERFRGPKPDLLQEKQYFVCLGAAQTFGRFCPKPYPNILREQLNLPVLNLSNGGVIPDWFLERKKLLEYTNNAKFVIVQVMSARTVSNSLFESKLSGAKVVKRETNTSLTADEAYQQLIQTGNKEQLKKVVVETRQNWVNSYKRLLAEITVPKILLWFSIREPQYQENYEELESGSQLFKAFPQMVNMEMIEQIKSDCDQYIECVSNEGLPQLLVNRFTGESVINTNGQGIEKTYNNYYPSPEMHAYVAKALEPVCKKYAEPVNDSKNFRSFSKKGINKPDKLIIHCCYHKVATVFFMKIFKKIVKELNWNFQVSFWGQLTTETNILLQHNSEIDFSNLPPYVGSHIIRDPRDMIISGYLYHLWSTEKWLHLPKPKYNNLSYQELLKSLPQEEGISMEIKRCKKAIKNMMNWDYSNPNIMEIKLEDLKDEKGIFTRIFQKYGFNKEQLETGLAIVEKLSFEKLAGRKRGEEDKTSHFRKGVSGDWKNYFTSEHKELFHEMYPGVLMKLGYELDNNW